MTAQIKVKVQRKAIVKLKVLPRFPAIVLGENGIVIVQSGNIYTFSLDPTSDFTTSGVITAEQFIVSPTSVRFPKIQMTPGLVTSGTDGIRFLNTIGGGDAIIQPVYTGNASFSVGFWIGSNSDVSTAAAPAKIVSANQAAAININGDTGDIVFYTATAVGSLTSRMTVTNAGGVTISGALTATTYNGLTITTSTGTLTVANGKTATINNTLTFTGTDGSSAAFGTGGTVAYQGGTLAQFAATTSLQLAGVISDETGSGALVFATGPTFSAPNLGSPASVGTMPAFTLGGTVSGGGNQINNVIIGASTPLAGSFTTVAASTSVTVTSSSASALTAGRQGATNPALQVDASTATSATGLKIKSAAAAGGLALSVITSGTNENLTIDAAGSGTITVGGTSTGAITLTRATTMSAALTYGGVTLSNAVTGTGNMVLSASPTLTGTLTAAAANFSGTITFGAGTITGLTNKASPDGVNDYVIIYDAAGTAVKKATVGSVGSAGAVSSLNSLTGALSIAAGTSISVTPSTPNITVALSVSKLTNSLGAAVNLNNTANYFDGPSVAQGTSGVWFASGTVTCTDSVSTTFFAKLWDGTTLISSTAAVLATAGTITTLTLSGYITNPAGNIRISCKDLGATTGQILDTAGGVGMASTLSVIRVG